LAYAPLSVDEREAISRALTLNPDVAWAEIARQFDPPRHPGTIAREVTASGGRDGYSPIAAQTRADIRRRRPRLSRLAQPGQLRDRVTAELAAGRSPVAISLDLSFDAQPGVCPETIYQAVYAGVLPVKARDCLRSRRPRRRHRQTRQTPCSRATRPSIIDRPAAVNDRTEPGHWEIDTIIGARNRSGMFWLCERVTRFTIPVTLPAGYAADEVLAGLVEAFEQIPAHLRRSVTFDQGSEWAEWETLAATYSLDVYFCQPHSRWQRGQVEHHNRQARWWFPRGTDLGAVDPTHAQAVADLLNHQRRRSLHGNSPTIAYADLTAR
jgi:transposase, IS30 family